MCQVLPQEELAVKLRTYRNLRSQFQAPKMNEDLDDVVKRCASLFLSESRDNEILKQAYQILWEGQGKYGTE